MTMTRPPLTTTMTPRPWISGLQGLAKHLRSNSPIAGPILLIESRPTGKTESKIVQKACQHVQFLLAQQLGLRTVPSHSNYAFPTPSEVQQQVDLMSRVGASTVIAVGSGVAMDLAKAVPSAEHRILIPATHGALLAASTSHALILEDDSLIPSLRIPDQPTVVHLEEKLTLSQPDALLAALALAQSSPDNQQTSSDVHAMIENPDHDSVCQFLGTVASKVGYGLDEGERNGALAVAVALLPKIFPDRHLLSVLASLAMDVQGVDAPSLLTTESIETLRSHVDANRRLWGCLDPRRPQLQAILEQLTLT